MRTGLLLLAAAIGWLFAGTLSPQCAHAQGDPEFDEINGGGAPVEPITVGAGRTAVHFESAGSQLTGFVYRPQGKGPFPVIVWNHGGNHKQTGAAHVAAWAMRNGYALFEPLRRGVRPSQGVSLADSLRSFSGQERKRRFVELLESERLDIDQAVGVARDLTFVDKRNIYVAGCGNGAVLALLEAEANRSLRGAIAISPAAGAWDENPYLRERLGQAARKKRIPILLLQAGNEPSHGPVRVLGPIIEGSGAPSRSKIYGAQGHGFCMGGMKVWGPDAVDFLRRSRVK